MLPPTPPSCLRGFILQGVASASPDSTESQVEDTEDPWELQRLRDAWLAKEFFYKKKN